METTFIQSLTLVDLSGYIIIATILAFLAAGVALTFAIRARYGRIREDLHANRADGELVAFDTPVLNDVLRDVRGALRLNPTAVSTQAIIDHNFQRGLRGLLIGERFVRASTGLMIILGLVGTFYGLTLSLGRLAALVSGEVDDVSIITESLTAGLTQALTGMSVAFSTSLFGILSAIVMTLLGVFCSIADRRQQVMAELETYLEHLLLREGEAAHGSDRIGAVVAAFGETVGKLEGSVARFEQALETFATNTRDFQEFNLHLKDNVQRMSLSFGDLSEALKQHLRALGPRG
jgi:methyl-accepting chemotaxis protein